jgi:hypothetical protein
MNESISELIIKRCAWVLENNYEAPVSSIDDLISIGELIDRGQIVNKKLFELKNEVMRRKEDKEFLADAAIKDIHLCEERSRIKRAIDEKIFQLIVKAVKSHDSPHNPEVKFYA